MQKCYFKCPPVKKKKKTRSAPIFGIKFELSYMSRYLNVFDRKSSRDFITGYNSLIISLNL